MIRIIRPESPSYFKSERVLRANSNIADQRRSVSQSRLKFDSRLFEPITKEIASVFNHKCAYCESAIRSVSVSELDTFRPKAGSRNLNKEFSPEHYWWLAYEWENIYLSCQICNVKYKRDWFPVEGIRAMVTAKGALLQNEKPLFVDPCVDVPEEHIHFKPDGQCTGLTEKGHITIEILGLNRQELIVARSNCARKFLSRLVAFQAKSSAKVITDLKKYVAELFSDAPQQEYAGMLRAVFKEWYSNNADGWENAGSSRKRAKPPGNEMYKAMAPPMMEVTASMQNLDTLNDQLSEIMRFSIRAIEIENFRSIEKLKLDVLPANEIDLRESWLLLLGDNGIGKSSILQAIALTLAGREQLKNIDVSPREILKRGKKKGFVKVYSYEHTAPIELHFNEKEFITAVEEPPIFILAYGATRLLPMGKLEYDPGHRTRFANVLNLFDYSVSLLDVKKWLLELRSNEFESRIAPALFDLLDMNEGELLILDEGELKIQSYDGDFKLDELSDGYKAIIALACDIMQTLSVDTAGYHSTQGIVLIDELGNHLHPRWRMKIVGALRRAFPKLQFIVTSHEPLCLRGLSHGEVVVFVSEHGKGKEKHVVVLDKSKLPDHNLLRIDQLLTSDLFGLVNTMDSEGEKVYEEYYKLLSKIENERTDEDKQNIERYQKILTDKEMLGSNPHMQTLYRVINESLAQRHDDNFIPRETIKDETVNMVKNMISDKKLDWL